MSYTYHFPALAGITGACCCLPGYRIVFEIKMVNKKIVKIM
jgi:hypothetical protein